MTTELGRIATYFDGLLPIKSHDLLIKRSCKITWQTKYIIHCHSSYDHQTWQVSDLPVGVPTHKITLPFDQVFFAKSCDQLKSLISPLPQCLLPPNLLTWSCTFSYGSYEKLKIYLHYQNACDQSSWEGGDMPCLVVAVQPCMEWIPI